MGDRNRETQGIIFSLRQQGEQNRIVTVLTPDQGIINCMLYGGPKSKLRSMVQPFNRGNLYLYTDNIKHSVKITDFDAKKIHMSLRENLYKSWAATLASEIVLKTKCAGDPQNAFILLSALLDGIDAVEEDEARLGMLRFLWRYLGLLGVQPDVRECISCGTSLLSKEHDISYIESLNGFVCSDCIPYSGEKIMQEANLFKAEIHSITYLAAINELSPGKVRELILPAESAYRLKRLLYHLIEKSAGTKLETLESGAGIL
ncbi:DNA repair protein RecO [Treponema sp.]|uniref:DNA repair protein RecO n=1 Tax=Treponema sp. TaxID=166 RepID=UPI00298DA802|nr:DNA repair protein RecO [Treponema sp.]MCQ2240584.1 DNA repair protein RecO [Treponema sp.]